MTKTDISRKVTQEFIDAALKNKTSYSKNKIAAYIYDLHPDKFNDKEDARKYVRLVTGSMGVKYQIQVNRKYDTRREYPVQETRRYVC